LKREVTRVGASYKKLWKLLIDREMKKRELCVKAGVSTTSLAKLGRGENVNTELLIKICLALNCSMDDIMEIVPPEPAQEHSSQEL
jgi:DNA-binding Xre family transcriptional regulator